jgi:hypothetical protein
MTVKIPSSWTLSSSDWRAHLIIYRYDYTQEVKTWLITMFKPTSLCGMVIEITWKVKSLYLTNLVLRHKSVWKSGCINPHNLNLGTSWRWVVSVTLRPLYPRRNSFPYQLDRRLGGPQSQYGRRGEEKIIDFTGTRTPNPQSSGSQSLYRLRHPSLSSKHITF